MLLTSMILCAVAAIILFAHEAFEDLYDAWRQPEHRAEHDRHHPRPGMR
jgi:hypothetical protein